MSTSACQPEAGSSSSARASNSCTRTDDDSDDDNSSCSDEEPATSDSSVECHYTDDIFLSQSIVDSASLPSQKVSIHHVGTLVQLQPDRELKFTPRDLNQPQDRPVAVWI